MNALTNLDSLERRAWRSVHHDGLLDMYLGLVLVAFAIPMILGRLGATEAATMLVYTAVVLGGFVLFWLGNEDPGHDVEQNTCTACKGEEDECPSDPPGVDAEVLTESAGNAGEDPFVPRPAQ